MFRVRYYDKLWHPRRFRGSSLGTLIRFLNWFRWKLELLVQYLVTRWEAKQRGLSPAAAAQLLDRFKADAKVEAAQKLRTDPVTTAWNADIAAAVAEVSNARYGAPEPSQPRAGNDVGQLIQRFTASPRQRRYIRQRGRRLVHEDWEPVPKAGFTGE